MASGSQGDVCSHVKVVVRVRPENAREKEGSCRKVVHVVDNHMLVFDPKEQEVSFFQNRRVRNRDVNKRANKDLKFVFDGVFAEDSTQAEVFENSTKGVVDGVLNGYNCTVFAYGATGAGKTHTMLGMANEPGVMYHTMKELYSRIEQVKDEKVFDIAVSYLEVYNEQIRDLLSNSGPLAVREDGSHGVVVQGLALHQPKSAEHILEALDYGNRNRTQHPTDVNASSSRSHAVFQIYVKQQDKTASINQNVRIAKMSLIDLAGSERASATNTKGMRFREGANINRSLLALGNVINALADPKSKKSHIPYRDSKLTRLLKDSLGGNCRTIMIANVSPSSLSYDDTYNTLKYANRAKDIKSALKSNVVNLDSHVSQYAVICEKQKKEILLLKQKLKEYEEKTTSVPVERHLSLLSVSHQRQAEIEKLEESLKSVFSSRIEIRKEYLSLEKQLKENELKAHYREQCHQQIQLLCSDDKAEKATCKHERRMASLLTQRLHLKRRLQEAGKRFEDNDGWLHRVENELKLCDGQGHIPQVLQKDLRCHRLQLEVLDLKQHVDHMTYLIGLQDQENKQTKKLLSALLPAFRRQAQTLREAGLCTPAGDAELRELEQLVQREKGVVWADQPEEPQEEPPRGQPELSAVIGFSRLMCHANTPCSSEKRARKALQNLQSGALPESPLAKPHKEEPAGDPRQSAPPPLQPCQPQPSRMPTRRKLAVSPLVRDSAIPAPPPPRVSALQDALSQEGMYPLQYTPEVCRALDLGDGKTPEGPRDAENPDPGNPTFNLAEDGEAADPNATIVVSPGSSKLDAVLGRRGAEQEPGGGVPSLNDEKNTRQEKPSYMAMTSAAQRKRKLRSYSFSALREAVKENAPGPSVPKRLKQDLPFNKPLRVRRFGGSEEVEPARRVARSVSDINLNLVGVKKWQPKFLRTARLKK
ncbi:kinesin-like protein KIF18A isoform X2 [Amia ocellicauda]|uniref:kinesin-like protein KIF18A isoform X2 n=1 Tax=Amia ocellicauda TaxID=2972642 RepID=UPI003463D15A